MAKCGWGSLCGKAKVTLQAAHYKALGNPSNVTYHDYRNNTPNHTIAVTANFVYDSDNNEWWFEKTSGIADAVSGFRYTFSKLCIFRWRNR